CLHLALQRHAAQVETGNQLFRARLRVIIAQTLKRVLSLLETLEELFQVTIGLGQAQAQFLVVPLGPVESRAAKDKLAHAGAIGYCRLVRHVLRQVPEAARTYN